MSESHLQDTSYAASTVPPPHNFNTSRILPLQKMLQKLGKASFLEMLQPDAFLLKYK